MKYLSSTLCPIQQVQSYAARVGNGRATRTTRMAAVPARLRCVRATAICERAPAATIVAAGIILPDVRVAVVRGASALLQLSDALCSEEVEVAGGGRREMR